MSGVAAALPLGLALAGGGLLGAFYFGTLWLVVRRLDRLASPAAWLGVTGILRLGIVLGLFTLLFDARWERLLVGLAGFLTVRVVFIRWLGGVGSGLRGPRPSRTVARGGS